MTKQKKYREFWIDGNFGDVHFDEESYEAAKNNDSEKIHTIEYAAIADLEAQIKVLVEALEDIVNVPSYNLGGIVTEVKTSKGYLREIAEQALSQYEKMRSR